MDDSGGWREALHFLNHFAETTSTDAQMFLPGVYRVRVVNRGKGGWVRLAFYDYTAERASELAGRLLLPEPEPVDPRDADYAFEGVPAREPADGAGVFARQRTSPPVMPAAAEADFPRDEPRRTTDEPS
jgi:hypothetical protein